MSDHLRRISVLYVLFSTVITGSSLSAADGQGEPVAAARFEGARALLVQPENSYYGYDFTIQVALMQRGFEVVQGQAEGLTDPAKLSDFDLVVTNLKRRFTPEQVAGLQAYLRDGGALYANWGGPMGCPPLLRVFGVNSAHSVYIRELTLTRSPVTADRGEQRWVFPDFVGHVRLPERGHEMVAFERTDGIEIARDSEGRCLGTLREEGRGRCALLGFCPSNYRFVTDDPQAANGLLDGILAWLLPRGTKPHPMPDTFQVCLPRQARIMAVSVAGRPLPSPQLRQVGSLVSVTVPSGGLAEDDAVIVRVDCALPETFRPVETWIHDPVASSFNSFAPQQAADFLSALHTTVVQPLLRYEGGSCCFLRGVPGDRPRERIAEYDGDLLADYIEACHSRGIKVIGGLYLDWKRFEQHLKDAPPYVGRGEASPERKTGQPVCPLDPGVQGHNLAIVENLLDNYPGLDGVILDDNFEFHQRPCHCAACLEKFAAYCARIDPAAANPASEAETGSQLWRDFWKAETLAFCRRIHDVCAAHGKPVGGWTAQRGPLAFRGVFDFAGDMVYVEPPSSVASLFPLVGDFPVVTLLWGMNRNPAGIEADFVEAIRAGSTDVGFWIGYARQEGITDNRWSLGTRPGDIFGLTPGTINAIERAFAASRSTWWDYYRDTLIQGDRRFVVTAASLDASGLTVSVKRLAQPSAERVVGPVSLTGPSTPGP